MSRPLSSTSSPPLVAAVPPDGKANAAFEQLESILLRQMLKSSGAFRSGSTPGAQLHTDLFIETLADAVAKAGGLGIGSLLQKQLSGHVGTDATNTGTGTGIAGATAARDIFAAHRNSIVATPLPTISGPRSPGTWEGLDDPNSDAPLPEDPAADSIDDYQPMLRQPIPTTLRVPSHAAPHRTISVTRALNSYRERAEVQVGDNPISASRGEEP